MSTPNKNCNGGASKSNEMNDKGQNVDIRNTDKQPPLEFKPFKFGNHDEKNNSSFGRSDGFNFGVGSSTSAASTSTSRHQFTFDTTPTGNDSGFRFNLDHVTNKPTSTFAFGEAKSKSAPR